MFSVTWNDEYFYEQILNMDEANINQEFRLKNIKEIKSCFIKEMHQNEFRSMKHKKVPKISN